MIGEYSWDERGLDSSSANQNDLLIGTRLALNDISDSQILFGLSSDLSQFRSNTIFLEGSTRINNNLSLNVEMRIFSADAPRDLLFGFRDDDFIQIGLEFFF